MRPFTARRLALAALVPALLLLSVIPGCSNQSEGERCTEDVDCDSALKCTLIDRTNDINRCCYADGHVTDSRCVTGGSTSATGGSSVGDAGASSTAGGGSSGASTEAGAAGLSTEVAGAGG